MKRNAFQSYGIPLVQDDVVFIKVLMDLPTKLSNLLCGWISNTRRVDRYIYHNNLQNSKTPIYYRSYLLK